MLSLAVSYMTNMSMLRIRPGGLIPVLAVLALLLGPRLASAQPDGDRHLWVQAVAVLQVSEHWRVHLEEQPRWFDDVSAPFQNLLRGAVGRQVVPRISLWAGYGWVAKPPGSGGKQEHRAWQQFLATPPAVGRWTSELRVRQEQRYRPDWDGTSHRVRVLVRTAPAAGCVRVVNCALG